MDDLLSLLPGYALRRASAAMLLDLSQRLSPIGLTPTEASIMMLINANGGITQSDLCRILGIKRANMTPLTARLEDRSLIERQRANGRSQSLALSTEGRIMLEHILAAVAAHEAFLIGHVPRKDQAAFVRALQFLWNKPEQAT
jgi:DNA-binding MarR family transcriptional regulator